MIMLVSLIVLLRGFSCFHDFSRDASHPYVPIHLIFALVPHIFVSFALLRACVHNSAAP